MAEGEQATEEWKTPERRVAELIDQASKDNLEKYYPEFVQEQGDDDEATDESGDSDGAGDDAGESPPDAAADSGDANDYRDPEGATDSEPEGEGEHGEEPESSAGDDEPIDLKALAERTGIEIDQLYDVQVAMGQGREPLKLGELKDYVNELHTLDDRREALITQQIEHENAMLRDQQEIAMIVEAIGEVPESLRALAAEKQSLNLAKQREQLLQIFPEWADQRQYVDDRSKMVDRISRYGLTEQDLGLVQDARWIKVIADLTRYAAEAEQADAKQKRLRKIPKPVPRTRRRPPSKATQKQAMIDKAAASSDPKTKIAAVSELLNTGGR